MASSPASSDLSDPPSAESEGHSTAIASSRPSIDLTNAADDGTIGGGGGGIGIGGQAPPAKRRRVGAQSSSHHGHAVYERAPSSQPADDGHDDQTDISSDSETSALVSPTHHSEYAVRDEAQTHCLWRDCAFGEAVNNDVLVQHVQGTHCATGGPKKTKYVCEWGECQRKTSNHPSGYALKAHMRSHTKEKPYYCALPECDKAFTRSDALAKHMRTVHEPEPVKVELAAPGKKGGKVKAVVNGSGSALATAPPATAMDLAQPGPSYDEDGNPVDPSPASDNIQYIPAHHPVTGQPGFMINYPPDIDFSAWESSIPADQLLRLLRRQLHWAEQEGRKLKEENDMLEKIRREEWKLKEILLDGMLEEELARGKREGMLSGIGRKVCHVMDQDAQPARKLRWTGLGSPTWRHHRELDDTAIDETAIDETAIDETAVDDTAIDETAVEDTFMDDGDVSYARLPIRRQSDKPTPSPPPTGRSGGGFDGDADPYDNYLAGRMAEYEERERLRSLQNTPQKSKVEQQAAEADAVGALIGLSAK